MTPCEAASIRDLLARVEPMRLKFKGVGGGPGGHVEDVTPPPKPDPETGRHPIEHYTKDGTLYIRTFLINDKRNRNKWRASWNSIKENAKTFIGRPGIEYTKCDHKGCLLDHTNGKSFDDNLHIQEKYRRTTITDVVLDEGTHTAYAIHRVESPEFAGKIKRGEISWLSPSIWPNAEKTTVGHTIDNELFIDTTGWDGLHDAFVTRPAFGHEARIVAKCTDHGDGSVCRHELKSRPLTAAESAGAMLIELAKAVS